MSICSAGKQSGNTCIGYLVIYLFAAYTDQPLADAEWIEKYQEEMKANEELERSLKDRLQANVELKEW